MLSPIASVRVLFTARSETTVRTDNKSLRRLGFSLFKTVTNSAKAFKLLTNEPEEENTDDDDDDDLTFGKKPAAPVPPEAPAGDLSRVDLESEFDFIVSDEVLQDMDAPAFARSLKTDSRLPKLPLLVMVSTPSLRDALNAEGVATLARPYSLDQLERAVVSAAYYFRGPLQAERIREQEALNQKKQTKAHSNGDLYKTAVALLQQKRLPEGEKILCYILKQDKNHIPSYLALCQLYMAVKNGQKLNRFLLKAVVSCLRQGDMTRAKAFAAKLPEVLRKGNLFRIEADFLLREGDYLGAAATFVEAYASHPEDALFKYIIKTCSQLPAPDKSFRELCTGFAQNGHVSLARRMHIRSGIQRAAAAPPAPKQVVTHLA